MKQTLRTDKRATTSGARDKFWYVYLVKTRTGSLYCGVTTNLERRVKQHNDGKGSKYCYSRRPVVLAARFICSTRSFAQKLECKIKKMKKSQKEDMMYLYKESHLWDNQH